MRARWDRRELPHRHGRPRLIPLPIDAALDDIRAALDRVRAVVVVAEPGAGKTTRVPPALLDAGPALVLQPRRAAARAIARCIAAERGWTVGREVGWHVRFERAFEARTRLLIATEGMLTARLQQDPLLSDFATIVLDEFHERSIHADLAIALSKQAMRARGDLRLVVMSATIDASRVSSYLGGCPVVEVPGALHAITVFHAPHLQAVAAVERVLHETDGNVLCFQPGAREIGRVIDEFKARVNAPGVDVLPLHGTLPAAEQDRALSAGPRQRVIVCTNIAETSVTVPGVTAVVDAGLEKVARYDAALSIDSLTTERITQAGARQRAGRAGRTAPGVVYRLWDAAGRLRPFRDAEIHRVDLSGVVLDVLGWGGDPRTLDWFAPPHPDAVEAALDLLARMRATLDGRITDIGRRMLGLPLPTRLARIVVAANGHRDALRAVALLSQRHVASPRSATTSSDLLSALDDWDDAPEDTKTLARQLEGLVAPERDASPSGSAEETALRRAILAGYPDRVAQRREPLSPRFLLATGTGAALAAESGVRDADFVVALDVQASTRANEPEGRIRMASAVDRGWLIPTATALEHHLDERGVVRAREVEHYHALRLTERVVAPDAGAAAELLAAAWLAQPRSDAEEQLLRRLNFAGCDVVLPTIVRSAAYGVRSLSEIDLAHVLPREIVLTLETVAPESIAVPSGRRARLLYGSDGTVSAEVKLQELFGLADTPRVGPRHEPVVLALLAPNGRPVQITRDLRSFWDKTYPEVRKELRGRYPRHPWPEDPWTAAPTHRARPRS